MIYRLADVRATLGPVVAFQLISGQEVVVDLAFAGPGVDPADDDVTRDLKMAANELFFGGWGWGKPYLLHPNYEMKLLPFTIT